AEFVDAEVLEALAGIRPMTCTMFAVWGNRTVDGKLFSLRNLDWVSQVGSHNDRLVTVYEPDSGPAFVTVGYAGILGALAGMNEKGITLSEVGAFSVREELDGIPWTVMARQVLEDSTNLDDAVRIVAGARHTIGYNYLVGFGDPEHFGTCDFEPRAAVFETNHDCCEVFFDDDPKEHGARWVGQSGEEVRYGLPLKEAILRADTAFGERSRAQQAADNGPGDPNNDGDPRKGASYVDCHIPMHDMIRAYETGSEYTFPVRKTKVIDASAPCKIDPREALNIAATVAHNVEKLADNDWNVMSVVYGATDLDFWVAFESCDDAGHWRNAPDSGYWQLNLRELLSE
ncbi:MAG: C45 family autoproteolytic acyltransferase/hydrolase, partial [Candidatus Hydrogenedentales bacterium]